MIYFGFFIRAILLKEKVNKRKCVFQLLVSQKTPLPLWELQEVFVIKASIYPTLWKQKARNVIIIAEGFI